jgi:hypothetical protein
MWKVKIAIAVGAAAAMNLKVEMCGWCTAVYECAQADSVTTTTPRSPALRTSQAQLASHRPRMSRNKAQPLFHAVYRLSYIPGFEAHWMDATSWLTTTCSTRLTNTLPLRSIWPRPSFFLPISHSRDFEDSTRMDATRLFAGCCLHVPRLLGDLNANVVAMARTDSRLQISISGVV